LLTDHGEIGQPEFLDLAQGEEGVEGGSKAFLGRGFPGGVQFVRGFLREIGDRGGAEGGSFLEEFLAEGAVGSREGEARRGDDDGRFRPSGFSAYRSDIGEDGLFGDVGRCAVFLVSGTS